MIRKIEKHYHWVIVFACFMLCFAALGICGGNRSLYLAAVPDALGIPRGAYSVGDSLRFIATSITNLFFGALMMKFGPRKMVGVGMCTLVLSCLINSLAQNVWHIYASGLLLGFGLTFTGTAFVGYVIRRWCKRNQGTILGLVLCSNALGSAVAAPWFTPMILGDNPFGFRDAYRISALIALCVGILIVALIRDTKEEKQLPQKKKAKGNTWEGITLQQALRKPYFYIACVSIFFTGAVLQSVNGVASAHMKDQGLGPDFIATTVSIHALALAAFKFLSGWMYDRKGLKFTMLICDGAAVVMILLLALVTSSPEGRACALAYAVLSSLALPLETVMLPLIAGDLFGEKEYSKMLGVFVSVNTAGYASGPLISNLCFDAIGTYRPVFIVYAVLMLGVTIAFLFTHRQVAATRLALSK